MSSVGVPAPFMLQITARHFTAGISPKHRSAPILYWMIVRQWDESQIRLYCQYHGWGVTKLPDVDRRHVQPADLPVS